MKNNIIRLWLIVLSLTAPVALRAASVTLDWDPVTLNDDGTAATDLSGYRLFQSTRSLLALTTGQAMADASITRLDYPASSSSAVVSLAASATYFLRLSVYNASGSMSELSRSGADQPAEITVFVPPAGTTDTVKPLVAITSPSNGAVLVGNATISITASDDVSLAGIGVYLDTTSIFASTSAPFSFVFDTRTASPGAHSLTALAVDSSNNFSTHSITVTISSATDLTAPVISAVSIGALTATSASVSWTTSEPADSQVAYGTTTALGQLTALAPALVSTRTAALSGLNVNTTYYFSVRSRDAAGNLATSAPASFFTRDSVRPTVAILSPANGAVVSGTMTVTVAAADDIALAGIAVYLDTTTVFASTAAPFAFTLNTRSFASGSHSLLALAADSANNVSTHAITVTVDNADRTPPVISMTSIPVSNSMLAVVTWTTDEPADSTVLYGTSTAYGRVASSATFVTSHGVALGLLSPLTLYHFRIFSRDASGNLGSGPDQAFLTRLVGPVIAFLSAPGVQAATGTATAELSAKSYLAGGLTMVKASVTPGDDAVRAVRLVATSVGGTSYDRIWPMRAATDGSWSGLIDNRAGLQGGAMRYYAEVEDAQGRTSQTPVMSLQLADEITVAAEGGKFSSDDGGPADRQVSVRIPADQNVAQVSFKRLDTAASRLQASRERGIDQTAGRSPIAAYDLNVPGRPAPIFSQPVTLTLAYPDADGVDVDGDGIPDGDGIVDGTSQSAASLKVFWHDGIEWRLVGGVVDKSKKTVTVQVGHFSTYGLFASASAGTDDGDAPALEKFLSPSLADGINDVATFGPSVDEVSIFDLAGRRVFRAGREGASTVSWAGRDQSGTIVESGVYIARLKTQNGHTLFQRFAVVK